MAHRYLYKDLIESLLGPKTPTGPSSSAGEYYKNKYHFQYNIFENNFYIYDYIDSLSPTTLFEFGCNIGRHLNQFRERNIEVYGIDISERAIEEGRRVFGLRNIWVGDDTDLPSITKKYDVVYVNSVLCHIPEVDEIIDNLKRIGKIIVIFEAPDREPQGTAEMAPYWFPRDYEQFGFEKIWEYYANSCKAKYCLYHFE